MAIVKRLTQGGQTRYVVRMRDELGQWFPSRSFSRKVDAQAYEHDLKTARGNGRHAVLESRKGMLLEDYCRNKWAVECRDRVSDGWKITQQQMLRDYVLPHLGKMKVGEIRPEHIGKVLRAMEVKGRGGQSRLHVYNLLHNIFENLCEYHDILSRNPVLRRDRPSVPVPKRTHLTPEQARRLLESCTEEYIGPAIWIGLLAGLRPGEIQVLRWQDVDFQSGVIHIRQALKRKSGTIGLPKSGKEGMVVMHAALAHYLRRIKDRVGGSPIYVTPSIKKEFLEYQAFNTQLSKCCRDAKVPRVTPHELRHSSTELWIEAGGTEEDLVRLLNHSGAGTVRRYIHPTMDRMRSISNRIELPFAAMQNLQDPSELSLVH